MQVICKKPVPFPSHIPMEDLPDDLLLLIFQKIERVDNVKKQGIRTLSRTSKRWNTLSACAVTTMSISGFKSSKMPRILSRFTMLRTLNLAFLFDCTEDVLVSVAQHCPLLEDLHVADSYRAEDGRGLCSLAKGCPKLQSLTLNNYRGPESALVSLAESCTSLRTLQVRSAPKVTDRFIVRLAECCPRVRELDTSFNNITDEALRAVGSHLKDLAHLDLKHCKHVTGDGVAYIAAGCPQLKFLHLGVVEVGEAALEAIATHSKHLECLFLDYGWGRYGQMTRQSLSLVASGCPTLRVLSLRGSKQVDNGVVQGLSSGCKSLEELDLHACEALGDQGLRFIVQGCKKLRSLVLTGCSVGSTGVDCFTGGLPQLRALRMNGNKVTSSVLESVSKHCKALEDLHLNNCSVDDAGIEHLTSSCKGLKSLHAKACQHVTGKGFKASAEHMENLNLSSTGLTNEGLMNISDTCPNLVHLSMSSCRHVSIDCLLATLPKLRRLKELNIVGWPQVNRADMLRMTKLAPFSLKNIRVSRPDSLEDEYSLKRSNCVWILPNWARMGG